MGCYGCLKVLMFIFNGVIFLAGAAILGIGIWVTVSSNTFLNILSELQDGPSELKMIANVSYLLIALGSLLLVVGFLGCCGAATENKCMLLTFFVIILLIFLAEVAGAIVILAFKPLMDELFSKLGEVGVESIRKDYGENSITGILNVAMTTLECCGFNGAKDFENSPFYNNEGNKFPSQCCPGTDSPCDEDVAMSGTPVPGCLQKIKDVAADNTVAIAGVALAIAFLEICAMVSSMMFFCRVKSTRA